MSNKKSSDYEQDSKNNLTYDKQLERQVLAIYNSKDNPLKYMISSGGRVRFVSSKEANSTD